MKIQYLFFSFCSEFKGHSYSPRISFHFYIQQFFEILGHPLLEFPLSIYSLNLNHFLLMILLAHTCYLKEYSLHTLLIWKNIQFLEENKSFLEDYIKNIIQIY